LGQLETVALFSYGEIKMSARRVIAKKLNPVGLSDFMNLKTPARQMLLEPILPTASLSMLYGPRGGGKTFLALAIGLAVSSGTPLLRWGAWSKPCKVLYIDGEMPTNLLQARIKLVSDSLGVPIANDKFSVLAADRTQDGLAIDTEEGQKQIEKMLVGKSLVVFDNLATLTHGNENVWLPVQQWLLKLRRKGIACLIIHHSGTSGKQRGSSRREDALDCVIGLKKPTDYKPEHGCRFEVHMEKCRHYAGGLLAPFEARLTDGVWSHSEIVIAPAPAKAQPQMLEQAKELFQSGASIREVAIATGLSKSSAWRLRQQAVNTASPVPH
jgi:putative DNA primase/helicase